ncbi:hypothetical protein SESBI_28492 [Sesbania bispinosa]|nr:hypothetical protein SESBI_28492 [Sesbania bispinosa]
MESIGIPCEHVLALLNYLEIKELLESLVLNRWTKNAKQCAEGELGIRTGNSGPMLRSRVISLLFDCYEVCRLAGKNVPNLELSKQVVRGLLQQLRQSVVPPNQDGCHNNDDGEDVNVRDPACIRTKGSGPRQMGGVGRGNRRTTCCSICQGPDHNKKTCSVRGGQDAAGTTSMRVG